MATFSRLLQRQTNLLALKQALEPNTAESSESFKLYLDTLLAMAAGKMLMKKAQKKGKH